MTYCTLAKINVEIVVLKLKIVARNIQPFPFFMVQLFLTFLSIIHRFGTPVFGVTLKFNHKQHLSMVKSSNTTKDSHPAI
jgi:hypothetical protein